MIISQWISSNKIIDTNKNTINQKLNNKYKNKIYKHPRIKASPTLYITKTEAKTPTAKYPARENEAETAPFCGGAGASEGVPEIDGGEFAGTSAASGVGAVTAGDGAAAVVVGDGAGETFLGVCTEGDGAGDWDWAMAEATSNAAIAAINTKLERAILERES